MQGETMRPLLVKNKSKKPWRDEMYYHYYEKSFGLTAHYGEKPLIHGNSMICSKIQMK